MNPNEYERMAEVETQHWWYAGLRDAFGQVLKRVDPESRIVGGRILDAGCGTGQNLRWLQDTLHPESLYGFDLCARAVEISKSKVPEATVLKANLCELPQAVDKREERLDLVLCSDVLYTTDLTAAIPGLKSLCDRLRSGGVLLLHLPAFRWLYSRHDVAVHTRHRFSSREVSELLTELGLRIELNTYRMCFLFPLVVCRRLPSLLFGSPAAGADVRSDLKIPHRVINVVLKWIVCSENRAIGSGIRLPWGSSLIAVGRKP
jgi:SAM-dependent methyltransferase